MYTQEEKWLLEEKFGGMESEAFHADVARLQSGTPLAYLIGSIPFLNCAIYLDSHPLIPRTETEFWTEKAIDAIHKYVRTCEHTCVDVLDLCAGSGAIGVAVATEVLEASIDFCEIDPTHLSTIKKNITENLSSRLDLEFAETYRVIESNLFTPSSRLDLELGRYDFILTNPPYIDPAVDRVEESVRGHEPSLALYGGAQGMECIEKIIEQAPKHLTQNGQLWIEHEPEQTQAITTLAVSNNVLCSTHKDQYNVERYSVLVLQ